MKLLFIVVFTIVDVFAECREAAVRTDETTYVGEVVTFGNDTGVSRFLGIRYGEAPSGQLRFRAPKPYVPTEAVTEAKQYGRVCPPDIPKDSGQNTDFDAQSRDDVEDCLNLNVFTPEGATAGGNYSVMVWIHGGAFMIGSANDPQFDARAIVGVGDVIVVTVNYRLEALGMLYSGTEEAPGNLAFRDQILALKWVRDNIAFFGGNPADVTIFGESAGAISVGALILSPLARGLFRRAIIQSGTPNANDFFFHSKESNLEYTRRVAEKFDCFSNDKVDVDCLRNVSVRDMQRVMKELNEIRLTYGDDVMPERPAHALKNGKFNKDIDILFGVVEDEGSIFYKPVLKDWRKFDPGRRFDDLTVNKTKDYIEEVLEFAGVDSDTIRAAQESYTQRLKDGDGLRAATMRAFGEAFLTCPTVRFGDAYAKMSRGNAYSYRTVQKPKGPSVESCKGWMGVCHGVDKAYIFGAALRDFPNGTKYSQDEKDLSADVIKAWTEFAKTGAIAAFKGVPWQHAVDLSFKNSTVAYMEIGYKGRMVSNKYVENCYRLWEKYLN